MYVNSLKIIKIIDNVCYLLMSTPVTYIRERDQKNKDKITELEASITTLEKSLSDSKVERGIYLYGD